MSGSVNKVIIIGNLGKDPEVRKTAGGSDVANLRIATSRNYTDKQGQRREEAEWHSVVLWAKLAELAGRWLKKGSKVYIEGRLQTRDWIDQKTGEKRYQTEIVGQEMTFLGGDTGGERRERAPAAAVSVKRTNGPRAVAGTGAQGPAENPYKDDRIAF